MASHSYEAEGQPANAERFTRIACDPGRSVVVEACAGSGKTWLLVARALRLLLEGAEPPELLAITFTRKAAQEMHARLMSLLKELALAPKGKVEELLLERGVPPLELGKAVPAARQLYERVLASAQPVAFDTFHGWFSRLLRHAPLGSGVPHGYALAETTGDLRAECFRRFVQELADKGNGEANDETRKSLERLYELLGDHKTHGLIDAFVDQRAEWWAAGLEGSPIEWLETLCGEDGRRDARLTLWEDMALHLRVINIARVLGKGAKPNQGRAVKIESAISAGCSIEAFASLLKEFCDDKGNCRSNNYKTKALVDAAAAAFGTVEAFQAEFEEVAAELHDLECRGNETKVLEINRHLFTVGRPYLDTYQSLKAERRVLDFTDLEWHAYRLMNDPEQAAYLMARLDSRYRHILLDEFQDTNPLQWCVVRSWLDAYGDDTSRPSLFIVGDPKQSIYRFRRADPRVFGAAREMLKRQGAAVLRTNHTRRNAHAVVDILNAAMYGNPIFSPQTTESPHAGQVWRLPLISVNFSEKTDTPAEVVLRDPLTVACEENENTSRLEEGRLLAKALLAARCELSNSEEPLCWKDVMLLVRKRTHLAFYESALREAGIPLISDRRGGLLDSLEALDLIALLSFLVTPCNNLALAHVLKSPVFGASDDDLIRLAECQGADWWTRLQAMSNASPPLKHAQEFLTPWIRDAAHLPVHDLLDRILHTGELQKKYAQAAPVSSRAQVLGNIDAFVELALNLDAGRYPSLQKFIEELTRLQKMGQNDSPDEADVEASADAVRILTVHSAKGLEARVVALLDANHSDASTDTLGILCEWPQDAAAPTHFSAFADKSERGKARDRFFTQEKELAEQEDWNLLYVAATRAKELLIVSGVASGKADSGEEIIEGSWYARLLHAAEYRPDEQRGQVDSADTGEFELPLFHPPVVEQLAVNEPNYSSVEIDEGVALHALLERLTLNARWPVDVPDAGTIARWLDCRIPIAEAAGTYARNILSNPDLESFFRPGCYDRAYNELDVMTPDGLMRFDRMVVNGGEIWILDYKRRVGDNERAAYEQQLQRYRRAVLPLFPGHAVRMVLISGDGGLLEIAADA